MSLTPDIIYSNTAPIHPSCTLFLLGINTLWYSNIAMCLDDLPSHNLKLVVHHNAYRLSEQWLLQAQQLLRKSEEDVKFALHHLDQLVGVKHVESMNIKEVRAHEDDASQRACIVRVQRDQHDAWSEERCWAFGRFWGNSQDLVTYGNTIPPFI